MINSPVASLRSESHRPRSVALAVAAIIAAATAQAASPDSPDALAEVVVTGSRIVGVTNENSPSPISVVTAEEIRRTGAANIEDVLSHMAGVDFGFGGVTNNSNNGGTGLSVVDLRGLGPARTLVLIDGVRLISTYSGTTEVTDISAVPVSMVERIEVLRDGASSIYGADAIGGVVNIITKKHEDGATFDVAYGKPQGSGGTTKSLAASLGTNTEKGNVMVAVSWEKSDPIEQAQRGWSTAPYIGTVAEGGSNYRSQLDVLQDANSSDIWVNGVKHNVHDGSFASQLPYDLFLPNVGKYKLNSGAPGWNYLTQGIERKQISLNAHYDLNEHVTFVAEGFYTDRRALGSLRPEPLLNTQIATGPFPGFIVPAWQYTNNPLGDNLVANLTPVQFGPRRYDDNSQTYRIHTGFEGTAGDRYHWRVGYVDQSNSTLNLTHNEGNFVNLMQITGLTNCVDVPGGCVAATPAQAAAAVAAGLPAVTSVPLVVPNWTQGPLHIFTPAQLAYLTFDNPDQRRSSQRLSFADINGPLFSLPAGEVKGALGVEHRNEFLGDSPNLTVQSVGPNASQPTAGGYNVTSVYAEINAPLLKDKPFAQALNLDVSGRYDNYSTFGSANTYKFGVEYTPIEDIRFRGTVSTGFRAPNVAELFGGTAITDLPANGDPCDTRAANLNGNKNVGQGVLTAGSTCSLAVANGAAVTNFQPSTDNSTPTQQQVLVGGNPKLSPEKSHQYTAGFVLTPRVTPGLTLAVDYYNVKIDNTVLTSGIVGATNVDTVLLGCYGAAQNKAYCGFVHRNAGNVITQIDSLATSFGVSRVSGIDYELIYDTAKAGLTLPFQGDLRFDLQLGQTFKNTQSNADGSISSYAGTFQVQGSETIAPKWKGIAALDYKTGPWGVHWDTKYTQGMTSYDDPSNTGLGNVLPDVFYHDISGSYAFDTTTYFKSASVVLGINNLLDKEPPFLNGDTTCKCNSIAGPYDFIGRYFYGRVQMKF